MKQPRILVIEGNVDVSIEGYDSALARIEIDDDKDNCTVSVLSEERRKWPGTTTEDAHKAACRFFQGAKRIRVTFEVLDE